MTTTVRRCIYCGEELDSERNVCNICMQLLSVKETKECPFCKKRVELTRVEDHSDYKLKFYNCGHRFKHFERSITDSVKIEDKEPKWYITRDPVRKITLAKGAKNYGEVFSLSCAFFQDLGKKILKQHSKQTKTRIPKVKLKKLESILSELYNRRLVDQDTYDNMNGIKNKNKGVRKTRNEYAHENRAFKQSSDQAKKDEAVAEAALKCVKTLFAKYGSLW